MEGKLSQFVPVRFLLAISASQFCKIKQKQKKTTRLQSQSMKKVMLDILIKYCMATIDWLFFFLGERQKFFLSLSQMAKLWGKKVFMSFLWAFHEHFYTNKGGSRRRKKVVSARFWNFLWLLFCLVVGRTDGPTDQRMDWWTKPLIASRVKMRERLCCQDA